MLALLAILLQSNLMVESISYIRSQKLISFIIQITKKHRAEIWKLNQIIQKILLTEMDFFRSVTKHFINSMAYGTRRFNAAFTRAPQ